MHNFSFLGGVGYSQDYTNAEMTNKYSRWCRNFQARFLYLRTLELDANDIYIILSSLNNEHPFITIFIRLEQLRNIRFYTKLRTLKFISSA
jgi:hypothetical protein